MIYIIYLKKISVFTAISLCISFCIGTISHAKTIIKYKETNYGRVVEGLRNIYYGYEMRINSHGKLEVNLMDYTVSKAAEKKLSDKKILPKKLYKSHAHVTFDSKGKKKVNAMYDVYQKPQYRTKRYVYGNKVYGINRQTTLIVYSKSGKILKKITPDLSKYRKRGEKRRLFIEMAEVIGKNKVRLFYARSSGYIHGGTGYGGILEVNIKTGNIKKIVSADNYVPQFYDGKYIYGYKETDYKEVSNLYARPKKVTFFRTSLQTKKTESFTVDTISFDGIKYEEATEKYAFYKGNIMCLSPDGNVYFGTFDSKKIERVGNLSKSKYFDKYDIFGFAMKSKNEFYLMYDPTTIAHKDNSGFRQRLFVVKYHIK